MVEEIEEITLPYRRLDVGSLFTSYNPAAISLQMIVLFSEISYTLYSSKIVLAKSFCRMEKRIHLILTFRTYWS